jgi:NADPH:quinone reductase-like Zn-dependent oxidoreductase
VITTCSKHNFELVKSLGAVEAFDYKDADCAAQIRKYTENSLKYVWDTISLESSAKICADAMSPGGNYGTILPIKSPRDDVKSTTSLGYTSAGEAFEKFGRHFPASEDDFTFMKKWAAIAERLVAEGRVKVHPPKVGKGLENVIEGMDLMRKDKVSGQKLVYVL